MALGVLSERHRQQILATILKTNIYGKSKREPPRKRAGTLMRWVNSSIKRFVVGLVSTMHVSIDRRSRTATATRETPDKHSNTNQPTIPIFLRSPVQQSRDRHSKPPDGNGRRSTVHRSGRHTHHLHRSIVAKPVNTRPNSCPSYPAWHLTTCTGWMRLLVGLLVPRVLKDKQGI